MKYRGDELVGLPPDRLNRYRGSKLTMIFQEPNTSLGVLISEGAKNIQGATWMLLYPSLTLVAILFCLNFIGDGLRDALDPKDR